ncbi:galactose mutarotase-like enzyme [Orenia metallireducens]|uniref:Galactose mutarotase n=1 Tax=Orenia metallireducens TaxID=1413210 RepID=A0A285FXD1_9FIRM|nr:aldose 1-epimerase family protein [Orenia metallireducens]PRX35599.1 galactose mutarotase-like enzyme [Orenia metallireducens]SNY15808.1 Galactose mutarotase [Orenia metallireducens]
MLTIIENELIKVKIASQGAEMTSLELKEDNQEYLWKADPRYWGRHAPVLFPIVGKVKNDQYKVDGEVFKLTQHGFARDNEFELVEQEEQRVVYRLTSSEELLNKYPYQFELEIEYKLVANRVEVTYNVKNKDQKTIYFSIGAHPAFNWPLEEGENKEDYYLEFEENEKLRASLLDEGLLSDTTIEFLANNNSKPLAEELFRNDALILKDLKSKSVSLKSKSSDREVKVEFTGFPYMGIWSPPAGAPFICIEPWYGVADLKDSDGNLKTKEGIEVLQPEAEFSCMYSISIK